MYTKATGSSPRVRGLRHRQRLPEPRQGIIPARAGFTLRPGPPRPGGPDHPRACGVYGGAAPRFPGGPPWPHGSSPRVRGLRGFLLGVVIVFRIIPARAGFTVVRCSCRAVMTDHPRACGVYVRLAGDGETEGGSSPRVRGLLSNRTNTLSTGGIIPARAGFTAS